MKLSLRRPTSIRSQIQPLETRLLFYEIHDNWAVPPSLAGKWSGSVNMDVAPNTKGFIHDSLSISVTYNADTLFFPGTASGPLGGSFSGSVGIASDENGKLHTSAGGLIIANMPDGTDGRYNLGGSISGNVWSGPISVFREDDSQDYHQYVGSFRLIRSYEPRSDLQVSVNAISGTVKPEGSLKLNLTITNSGSLAASEVATDLYLSKDSLLSADDFLFGRAFGNSTGTMAVGQTVTFSQTCALQYNTPPDEEYVFAKIRCDLPESNSKNNVGFKTLAPSLRFAATTQPDADGDFWISKTPRMPSVVVELDGLPANTGLRPLVQWTTSVSLAARGTSKGALAVDGGTFTEKVRGTSYTVDFDKVTGVKGGLAGGDLNITGKFTVDCKTYTVSTESQDDTKEVKILAKNPDKSQVEAQIDTAKVPANWPTETTLGAYSTILKKIVSEETSWRQFYAAAHKNGSKAGYPFWNTKSDGGVGLMQVTKAEPDAQNVWDWRANLAAGIAIFTDKLRIAQTYAAKTIQTFKQYKSAVATLNANRVANGLTPLESIHVPDWTADQKVEVALRAYNGASGTDSLGIPILQEYELAASNKGLIIKVNKLTLVGTARWVEVPISRRRTAAGKDIGDPNYVDDVLGQMVT